MILIQDEGRVELTDLTRDLEALRDEARGLDRGRRRRRRRSRRSSSTSSAGRAGSRSSCAGSARCRPRIGPGRGGRERGPRRDRGGARRARRRRSAGASSRRASRPRRSTSRRPAARSAAAASTRSSRPIREIAAIFGQFGFVIYEGPEVEDDLTNFQMLNIPPRPPGARPVGHALRRRRGPPPADPHVARPDPGDAPRRRRRSGRCSRAAATATRRSTRATPRSSSRSRA